MTIFTQLFLTGGRTRSQSQININRRFRERQVISNSPAPRIRKTPSFHLNKNLPFINTGTGFKEMFSNNNFLNYEDYEYEDVGLLNFKEPTNERRRKYSSFPLKLHRKSERRSDSLLEGFRSNSDLSSLITFAGLWIIWQQYLVRSQCRTTNISDHRMLQADNDPVSSSDLLGNITLPISPIQDLLNNVGSFG